MCYYRTADGKCKKHSDAVFTSYCVDGPCPDDKPTNADRIRSMTDEELVEFICGIDGVGDPDYCAIVEVCPDKLEFNMYTLAENCMRCCFRWLQQPVES